MFCKGESLIIQTSMAFNIDMKLFTEEQNWRSSGPTQPRYFTTCTNNWKKGVSFNQQSLFSTLRCNMISLQNKHIHNKSFNTYYEPPPKFKKQNFTEQRVDFYPVFEGIVQGIDDILTDITKIESMKTENSSVDSFISLNKSIDSINQELKNKEIERNTHTSKFPNIHIEDQNCISKRTNSKVEIDSEIKGFAKQDAGLNSNISVPAEALGSKIAVNTTEIKMNTGVAKKDSANTAEESSIGNSKTISSDNKTMVGGRRKYKKNKKNRRNSPTKSECNNSQNNKKYINKTNINKSRNKKHKNINIKSDKHKMKHSTLCDIIEDSYYENESDCNITIGPNREWLTERPFKKNGNNNQNSAEFSPVYEFNPLEAAGTSKMSAMEKCCKFLAKLPICKSINNKPAIKTGSLFQCSTAGAECSVINIPKSDAPTPSECGTEDSFIVYFSESPNKDNQSLNQKKFSDFNKSPRFSRRPSECDSDSSFVVCFGESSQSPQDCFMVDLDISNSDSKSMQDKSERMRSRYPSECESDDFIIFEEEEHDAKSEDDSSDSDSDSDSDTDSTFSNDSSYFTESETETRDYDNIGVCTCIQASPNCCSVTSDTVDSCARDRLNFDHVKGNEISSNISKLKKKVSFNLTPAVHVMTVWRFAYQEARKGPWEEIGRDRVRFKLRIDETSKHIEHILVQSHRDKIYKERFEKKND